MRLLAAVYGFEITRPICIGGLTIHPITEDPEAAQQHARDLNAYQLTATVTGESLPEDVRFNLEGVLSFIEHLDVVVFPAAQLVESVEPDASLLPKTLRMQRRNSGGGAVVARDILFPVAREKFAALAVQKLNDDSFCESTKFKSLFFKCIETFRQRSPFLEITYFLLYSGLESFARAVRSDATSRNSSVPIYELLKTYGFDVYLENPANLPRAISTYTHIRNSLFHNGEFQTTVRLNHLHVELKATEYLFNLSMLVSLTVFKAVGFDDGHVNWNAWIDRQLLQ
jgi:hypothetical protein